MRKYILFLLCIVAFFSIISCDKEDIQKYAEELKSVNQANTYVNSLNESYSYILSDEEVQEAKAKGLLNDVEIDPKSLNAGQKVVYKKKNLSYGMTDLSYWGANNNMTFVGALLKLNSRGDEMIPITGLERAPITLSLGVEGATGVDYGEQTVDTVTQSNVGKAINELVKGITKEGAQLPYIVSMQLTEVKAEEELNAALGLGFDAGGFFDFSSELDFSQKNNQTYAVLLIKQIYYTVNVDYEYKNGAFNLIDDSTTYDEFKKACPPEFSPVYVSSVSYGRIAAITIKSDESFNEIKSQLNVSGGYGIINADLESTLNKVSSLSGIECNCFLYGGSIEGNQNVLNYGNNIGDMLGALNKPYEPAKMVGMPISYQLSHISDNTSAKIGYVGEYYYAEVIDTTVSAQRANEITIEDSYGDYDKYGAGYIVNNDYLPVDISDLDMEYVDSINVNIEILITLSLKEKNDGYQEFYIYNAGVESKDVQKGTANILADAKIEHGTGSVDKNYEKYTLKAVISPEDISSDVLWISFDASGDGDDTWYAKDIIVYARVTDESACNLSVISKE